MANFNGLLLQASFRGIPFAVEGASQRFGRRVALHQYPFRDVPWPEDIGKSARKFEIRGFLIADSSIYGGGPVILQRQQLINACEAKGSGTLVHPTLGVLSVVVPEDGFEVAESLDELGRFPFRLACLESGNRVYPSALQDALSFVQRLVGVLNSAAAGDYLGALTGAATFFNPGVADALGRGASVISMVVSTCRTFVGMATQAAVDATSIFNMLVGLPQPGPDNEWGRFAGGATVGFLTTTPLPASDATVDSLISNAVVERAAVAASCSALLATAAGIDPNATALAAQAVVTSLSAAFADPADAIRILSGLFVFSPAVITPNSVLGAAEQLAQSATGNVIRRAILAGIANATAQYQPSSADDAANLRDHVVALFESEIEVAGDNGDDASYQALIALRTGVTMDLNTRGAGLPQLETVTTPLPLPSLVLAQQLYQDAARAGDLVMEADAAHPAFMPTSFLALAS